jgi:hypothetical protein
MLNLSELVRGGTLCLSKAGLHSSSTTTLHIAAPNGVGVDFAVNGKLYHKADTDTIATTVCAVQAVSTSCLYLVSLDTSATPALSVIKGTEILTANVGNEALQWPTPAVDTCPIGGFRVDTPAGYTFTCGSTTFASNNTVTYYDFMAVPDAPIVA